MKSLIILALLAQVVMVFSFHINYDYYVPRPTIKALNPRGIYMSIPHFPGIQEVDFHVNLNKPLENDGVGQVFDKEGDFHVNKPLETNEVGEKGVDFRFNVDKTVSNSGSGQILRKVVERWNGRWSFIDRNTRLNGGDTVYFWINVKKDGKEYRYDNGRFLVTEDAFSSEESHSSRSSGSFSSSEEYYRY